VSARIAARLAYADAWDALDVPGLALGAVREATALRADDPDVLTRLVPLETRAGLVRAAAAAAGRLAALRPTAPAWHLAARLWVRADDLAEAARCHAEATDFPGDTAPHAALALGLSRLRLARGETVAPVRLLDLANAARRRDDRDPWRALSLDAWLESSGREGGEALAEALLATGRPRAAVYVAAESAARCLRNDPPARADATRLLERCARIAEGAALPGEATAAWTARALLHGAEDTEARESLRDLLAERGRSLELAARLRADARRAATDARGAAWKGVAAIEIAYLPASAALALGEALGEDPSDTEAAELLQALAEDPAAEPAVRDTLWGLVRRPSLTGAVRARWLYWLGQLEEAAGDPCAAAQAYGMVDEPIPEAAAAYEGLSRVMARAEALTARATRMLEELHEASPEAARAQVSSLLATLGGCPGAFSDARLVARALGPIALHDDRVAELWERSARRAEDRGQRLAVLRRLATRSTLATVRARAAVACAELLDQPGGDARAAAEILVTLLDEQPDEPHAAATLAALGEHLADDALAEDALRAVARAATDPWERDLLARFAVGTAAPGGIFQVFRSCLSEPSASRERATALARLHDLLGDSATLLALRTRTLLAQTGPIDEGLTVARRFAGFDPLSPEATIAWFGAASLAGEPSQILQSASAVTGSLASLRDISAVTRTALVRLSALGAQAEAVALVHEAARAAALVDRGLRSAVSELAAGRPPAEAVRVYEALLAVDADDAERLPWLRKLVGLYRTLNHGVGELGALWRLGSLASDEALARRVDLAPLTGDRGEIARLREMQLATAPDAAARRDLLLAMATEYAAAVPPRMEEAMGALDRLPSVVRGDEGQALTTRALLALQQPEAAVQRLERWASECMSDEAAGDRLLCAAQIADTRLDAPVRALQLLRGLLRRTSQVPQALGLAEQIASQRGLRAEMLGLYDELISGAAGAHGRHALAYRRASFLEQSGDLERALVEHLSLFERYPGLGASFSAIERLASATGRHDLLLQALEAMAKTAPSAGVRARFLLRAADVSEEHGDDVAALRFERQAWHEAREPGTRQRLRDRARALLPQHPAEAREALQNLIDDELAAANQTWDDGQRQGHALRALEVSLEDLGDGDLAAAAAALYLRDHVDLARGRAVVTEVAQRGTVSEAARDAVLRSPVMMRTAPEASAEEAAAVEDVDESMDFSDLFEETEVPTGDPAPAVAPQSPVAVPVVVPETKSVSPHEGPEVELLLSEAPVPSLPPLGAPNREGGVSTPSEPAPSRPSSLRLAAAAPPPAESPALPEPHPTSNRPRSDSSVPPARADATSDRAPAPASSEAAPAEPRVELGIEALRAAMLQGDDAAAHALATRLARDDETREEALAIERKRFLDDPSRRGALDAMATLCVALRRPHEAEAVLQLRAVLQGARTPPVPRDLARVPDPPDGMARVIFPPAWGPFPELGAVLWETLGPTWRRTLQRTTPRESLSSGVFVTSPMGRTISHCLRLLQLPRTTPVILGALVDGGATVNAALPTPTLVIDSDYAQENPRSIFVLGYGLEGTRLGHLPASALPLAELARCVEALGVAYGRGTHKPMDAETAQVAARLVDGVLPRSQRRIEDLVSELGPRLTAETWQSALSHAQHRAGLLVSGDIGAAAEALLSVAPRDVPRDVGLAIVEWEPLRDLARFAISEEYLLLRW